MPAESSQFKFGSSKLLLIGTVALALAIYAFFLIQIRSTIEEETHIRLKVESREFSRGITKAIDVAYERIRGIIAFFSASQTVTEQEFSAYVNNSRLFAASNRFRAVAVMPVLRRDELEGFQAELNSRGPARRRLGYGNVTIRPEGGRDTYAPAVYVESPTGRNRILGYDIATSAERMLAATEAMANNGIRVTAPVTLSQDNPNDLSSILILGFTADGNLGLRKSDTTNAPKPIIIAMSYTPGSAIHDLKKNDPDIPFEIEITDVSGPEERTVYRDGSISLQHQLFTEETAHLGGRVWRIRYFKSSEAVLDGPPAWFWGLGALGFALLVALGLSVEKLLRGRELLSQKIDERTLELKSANEKLTELAAAANAANKAKSEFLANMSHELRTPLNSVIGFSHMITEEILGHINNTQYLQYATHIHTSARHLLDVISDILDISKIEAGSIEINEDDVGLRRIVETSVEMVHFRVDAKKLALTIDVPPDLPHLKGDARLLRQVIVNLLSNSVKFTPAGGEMRIEGRLCTAGGIALSVSDTGPGIAPEDYEKALEPFGQVRGKPEIAHEGTGLGLSLSKRLVEVHDGTLSIDSEVGVGTTVTLSFPRERTLVAVGGNQINILDPN